LVNFSGSNDEGFITYAFQSEFYYSMQGAKSGSNNTIVSYVNIPVMMQRWITFSGFYI
jgi:hypothetical protein